MDSMTPLCILSCAAMLFAMWTLKRQMDTERAHFAAHAHYRERVSVVAGQVEVLSQAVKHIQMDFQEIRKLSDLDTGYYVEQVDKQTGKRSYVKQADIAEHATAGLQSPEDILAKAESWVYNRS